MLRNTTLRRLGHFRKSSNFLIKRCSSTDTKLYEPSDEETMKLAKLQPLVKGLQRPPFVKMLFLGQVDVDLLAYPEFLGERRLKLLDANTEILKNMVDEHVNPKESDVNCAISEKTLELIRNLKLFGMCAPAKYGGLELTHTERARIYEILSEDTSLAAMIFSQETLGHKLINLYGNEQQKQKYLKKLVSGKWFAAYCVNEQEAGSDVSAMNTVAFKTDSGFLISGTKTWVMNADKADVFIVFARIKKKMNEPNKYYAEGENEDELELDDIGIFLIDKQTPGITVSARKDTLGVRGLHMCDVTFSNIALNKDHVLGDVKEGYDISKRFMVEDRYLIGVFALNILRKMQKDMTEYSIRRKIYGDNLCNYGLTQLKLARGSINIYAIESMIYFTTGIQDMFENCDCELENAITKVFCSEVAWQTITEGMQLLGGQAYIKNEPYERYFRDLKILSMFDVSNEVLKMFIALCGLKYISNDINNEVVQIRNPFFHPKELLKKTMYNFRSGSKNPKLYLKLYENLHPSFCQVSDQIERCILQFEYALLSSLGRKGTLIVNDQFALNRIAEGCITLYAMIACISRASRSYSIGSKNTDEEKILCEAFIEENVKKFNDINQGLIDGDTSVVDGLLKKVASKTIKSRGYYVEEPLKLNY